MNWTLNLILRIILKLIDFHYLIRLFWFGQLRLLPRQLLPQTLMTNYPLSWLLETKIWFSSIRNESNFKMILKWGLWSNPRWTLNSSLKITSNMLKTNKLINNSDPTTVRRHLKYLQRQRETLIALLRFFFIVVPWDFSTSLLAKEGFWSKKKWGWPQKTVTMKLMAKLKVAIEFFVENYYSVNFEYLFYRRKIGKFSCP